VQITVDLSDITAAVIQLPNRAVLVALVYVLRGNRTLLALQQTLNYIQQLIRKVYRQASTKMDILIVGDFNRHNQL
jgi:exonuclease III